MGADVVQGEDVWVAQRSNRVGLLLEPPQPLWVGRELPRQHLDRDVAAEPRVAGAVHLAHPTSPNRGHDLVRAKANAGFQLRGRLLAIISCLHALSAVSPDRRAAG